MTSENKAPECGHPFCGETCGSAAIEAPHTQRELDDVPNGEREVTPELAEGMRAMKALLARIVAAESELTTERAKSARLVEALTAIGDLETVSAAEFKARHPKLNAALDEVGREQWFVELSWFAHDAIAAYEVKP